MTNDKDSGYYCPVMGAWIIKAETALRQPTQSSIFDASDVQKHTLIVDQDYASYTVKVKSLDNSQPTQSDALREALEAAPLIGATESVYDFMERQEAWLRGPYRAALDAHGLEIRSKNDG